MIIIPFSLIAMYVYVCDRCQLYIYIPHFIGRVVFLPHPYIHVCIRVCIHASTHHPNPSEASIDTVFVRYGLTPLTP